MAQNDSPEQWPPGHGSANCGQSIAQVKSLFAQNGPIIMTWLTGVWFANAFDG